MGFFFFSQSEFLTWDNVEDQVGPHGPRWLHSQYWAAPQRCREWWMKTAVWSSPLPEDRSKWLQLCLHIWAEEGWQIKTKGRGVGGVQDKKWKIVTLLQNSHSGWKTKHKQDYDDSSVSRGVCVAVYYSLHSFLWKWANCCNTFQLSLLCQNAHAAKRHPDTVTWHHNVPNAWGDGVKAGTSLTRLQQLHAAQSSSSKLLHTGATLSFLYFCLNSIMTPRAKSDTTVKVVLCIISNVQASASIASPAKTAAQITGPNGKNQDMF